jgi:plastocyanin
MNKIISLLFFSICGFLASLPMGCTGGPSTPTTGAAGTVTATGSDTFSPSAVTIMHGSAVTFVLGSGTHSLYIDNGSGTCAQHYTTWPQTITFPSAGTFSFHCQYHSPCGTTSCSSCTGMTGQVIVQ